MKRNENNITGARAFIRIAMQHILMLCMFIGLVSCEDKQQNCTDGVFLLLLRAFSV